MKEYNFGYTSHDWYSVAKSFITLGLAFAILFALAGVLTLFDSAWLSRTIAGSLLQEITALLCIILSVYCGFIISNKLFERKGKLVVDGGMINIHLGKKIKGVEANGILAIEKRVFSSFSNTNRMKSKILGPLYVQYTIVLSDGILSVCSSAIEGWSQASKNILKGTFQPDYSIETAFESFAKDAGVKITAL